MSPTSRSRRLSRWMTEPTAPAVTWACPPSATQRYYVLVVNDTEYRRRRCSMPKQVTEMLKGTLEGIVLAILSGRPAYGYEITAWLREQGFPISPREPLRAADQDRAARLRRRGKGALRRRGRRARCTRSTLRDRHISKSSGGPGASSQNGSNSPRRRR